LFLVRTVHHLTQHYLSRCWDTAASVRELSGRHDLPQGAEVAASLAECIYHCKRECLCYNQEKLLHHFDIDLAVRADGMASSSVGHLFTSGTCEGLGGHNTGIEHTSSRELAWLCIVSAHVFCCAHWFDCKVLSSTRRSICPMLLDQELACNYCVVILTNCVALLNSFLNISEYTGGAAVGVG
jgi:hypothetical protein